MKKENYSRKEFLTLAGAGAFYLSGLGSWSELRASGASQRTLIHILMEGGPDFRHLMVPKPNNNPQSYGYKYWNNRVTTTGRGSSPQNPNRWMEIYNRFYEEFTIPYADGRAGSVTFGVLKDNNGREDANRWLRDLLRTSPNRVAIINNVHHSTSRDHHHSLLVLQSGVYTASSGSANLGGWGGRLIDELGSSNRLLNFSRTIRPFCNTQNKQRVLSFTNSRKFGLVAPQIDQGNLRQNDRGIRAIQQYYQNLSLNLTNTPYSKFTGQRERIQNLTSQIRANLPSPEGNSEFVDVLPTRIQNLFRGNGALHNRDFARQIANLRDAFTVNSILNMRIASLNYPGWDSHKNQITDIEPQFDDLFGRDKALHSLVQELGGMNNIVFLFTGEFGRQLKSNGDNGTDHGRANTVIAIGGNVNGGIYGEMFPEIEAAEDGTGKAPFDYFNRDIQGRTSFTHVFNQIARWVTNNPSTDIFTPAPDYVAIGIQNHSGGFETRAPSTPINLNFI